MRAARRRRSPSRSPSAPAWRRRRRSRSRRRHPAVGQTIFFNAEASRAAAGRRIVSYDWDFGTGRTASGVTTSKSYSTPGTYTVTLTVTDDAGEKATTANTVTIGTTGLCGCAGRYSKHHSGGAWYDVHGVPLRRVELGRAESRSPNTASTSATTRRKSRRPSHRRNTRSRTRGVYVVSVTVRDSAGRTARTQVTVYVGP